MLRTTFTLIAKKQLTHDVYELIYSCPELTKEPSKPGQYVMFQLAPGLNRAYSLASLSLASSDISFEDSNIPIFQDSHLPTFTLIIKRISDGRGSPMICDAEVGTVFSGMIPLGHFTLQNTPRSKCFIGTGTGFAPLYCQMLGSLTLEHPPAKTAFIF
jgi:ferredoxin-NADP reductase